MMVDFIYGELNIDNARRLHAHIVGCNDCRKELVHLRRGRNASKLQYANEPAAPPAMPHLGSRKRKILYIAIPSGLAACLVVGFFIFSGVIFNPGATPENIQVTGTNDTNDEDVGQDPTIGTVDTATTVSHINISSTESMEVQHHETEPGGNNTALVNAGQDFSSRVDKLIKLLDSKSPSDQTEAADNLVELGKPILKILNRHLPSANPDLKKRIISVIDRIKAE